MFSAVFLVIIGARMQDSWAASLVADKLPAPFAVAFDTSQQPWFVEYQGHRLGRLLPDSKVVYVAGNGKKGDADGQPGALNAPHNLAIAPSGLIYLSDTFNHKIKTFDPRSGKLTTFAGTGKPGFSGDGGPASQATFNEAYHVTLDPQAKFLYVTDLKNQRIRKIDLVTNSITTIAGNGKKGTPAEGALASESPLNDPRAIIVDAVGQLYILQRGGNDLWKVDREGKLQRLAGTGKKGYAGDNGPAKEAQLNGPKHLCFDQSGNILIADTENHCIRKVDLQTGLITLISGRGNNPFPAPANAISLKQPHGVTVHPDTGDIYIADSSNNRIIRLKKD